MLTISYGRDIDFCWLDSGDLFSSSFSFCCCCGNCYQFRI